jgi:hypothetical protein
MVERCNDGNFCILGDIGILVLNEYKTYESYKVYRRVTGLLTTNQSFRNEGVSTTCCVV